MTAKPVDAGPKADPVKDAEPALTVWPNSYMRLRG
jgi:hypothetical protein